MQRLTEKKMDQKTLIDALNERKEQLQSTLPAKMQVIANKFYPHQNSFSQRLESLSRSSGSRRSKIHVLNQIVSDVRAISSDHIACKAGCANCCYQRVMLSQTEADAIGHKIGRPAKQLPVSYRISTENAYGRATPCTFLKDDRCSIYDARPFVCRNQVNLDVDNLLCSFENWDLGKVKDPNFVGVPMQDPGPPMIAYRALCANDVVGDIRDFFPK